MPTSPAVACSAPGCANYADYRGKCKQHAVRDERWRGTASSRGYDSDWRRLRDLVLLEDPLCVVCLKRGRYVPATEVDHIVTIDSAPERRLDRGNLQPLCKSCHSRKTFNEVRGAEVGGEGHSNL